MFSFLIIIFLTSISFLLATFGGRFLGKQGTILLSIFLMGFTFYLSTYCFYIIG
jgi:hypothetical protein